jgi:glycerol-3-phosphate dehydrogenase
MPAEEIAQALGATAESIDTVPLLAALCQQKGVEAPATEGLAALVAGRIAPSRWIEDVRSGGRAAA